MTSGAALPAPNPLRYALRPPFAPHHPAEPTHTRLLEPGYAAPSSSVSPRLSTNPPAPALSSHNVNTRRSPSVLPRRWPALFRSIHFLETRSHPAPSQ